MVAESEDLTSARRHLREVESGFRSIDAEFHLDEGLALLEIIAADGSPKEQNIANTIGTTYLDRFAARIVESLSALDVPEPHLKHLMRMSQILSRCRFAPSCATDLRSLAGDIAGRYIDALFEGYTKDEKDREIRRLMKKLEKEDEAR
ncbi:MAG TPA: hypothetical protein VIM81_20900 [Gammaproteobacteria bacterium]